MNGSVHCSYRSSPNGLRVLVLVQAMIIEELARRTPSVFVQHAPTFFNNVLSPALLDARAAVRDRAEEALAAALAVASSRETLFARKLEKRRLLPYQMSVAVPHAPTPTSSPIDKRGSSIFTASGGGSELERSGPVTGTLTRSHATPIIDAYIWCAAHRELLLLCSGSTIRIIRVQYILVMYTRTCL